MYVIIIMIIIINVSINIIFVVAIGEIMSVNPRINNMLKMLLPIALPIAMSVFLLYAAVTLVISSGRLVPMDTMVKPTSVSLIPRLNAISFAESTTKFPPRIMPTRPINMYRIIFGIVKWVVPMGMLVLSRLDLMMSMKIYAISNRNSINPSILLISLEV